MLELNDILLLLGCEVVISGLFAVITTVALGWWYGERLLSLKMGGLSPKGVAERVNRAERQEAAMIEFAQGMQVQGAKPEDVLKAVGLKYPDVAMQLIKKGMKMA